MKWLINIQKRSSTKRKIIIKSTQYQLYMKPKHIEKWKGPSKFKTMKLRKRIWKSTLKEKKKKILAILYEEVRTFKTFIVMKLWFQLCIFAMVGGYIIRIKQNFAFVCSLWPFFGGYVVYIDMWKCFLNIFNGPTQMLKDNKSWWRTFVIWSCGFSLEWGNHCHSSWNWAILPCILSSMSNRHEERIYVPFQFHHEHYIYIAPYILKRKWKRNMFHKCQYDYWWSYYIYYFAYYISTKLSHFLSVFEGTSYPRIFHGYFFFFCSLAWCF